MKNPYDHMCGLQGFGRELSDVCPACRYGSYRRAGKTHKESISLTYADSGLPTREEHERTMATIRKSLGK